MINDVLASWLTAIGTVGATVAAVFFGTRALVEQNRQDKIGLYLDYISLDGLGNIVNGSRTQHLIRLEKFVLNDELSWGDGMAIQNKLFADPNADKKTLLLAMKPITPTIDLIHLQPISPGEKIPFHIHDLKLVQTSLIFVLLKLSEQDKNKFYLFRYACDHRSSPMGSEIRAQLHPIRQWFRVYSFEEKI